MEYVVSLLYIFGLSFLFVWAYVVIKRNKCMQHLPTAGVRQLRFKYRNRNFFELVHLRFLLSYVRFIFSIELSNNSRKKRDSVYSNVQNSLISVGLTLQYFLNFCSAQTVDSGLTLIDCKHLALFHNWQIFYGLNVYIQLLAVENFWLLILSSLQFVTLIIIAFLGASAVGLAPQTECFLIL